MSTLEEQLALFEKEVLVEAQPQAASDAVVDQPPKPAVNNDAPKPQPARPIAAPPMAPRVVAARPTFTPIGPTARPAAMGLPPPGPMTNFIPNQLRLPPPMPPFMRPPHFPPMPPQMPAPVVIQSGPTLYASAAAANGAASADGLSASKKKKQAGKDSDQSTPGSSGLKTMVLPSDVELLAAKRQAAKSHDNSYLGQVMRGEKKMKRFVRTGGGQIWEDPSLAEWDPNDFRIFCGDLGNEVSDELLAKAFRKYPSFQKAKVVRDNRTNKSKGYGFVSFKHQDDFIRACREMDGKYVGNRPIKLRKSNWKERNLDMVRKKDREKKKLGLTM